MGNTTIHISEFEVDVPQELVVADQDAKGFHLRSEASTLEGTVKIFGGGDRTSGALDAVNIAARVLQDKGAEVTGASRRQTHSQALWLNGPGLNESIALFAFDSGVSVLLIQLRLLGDAGDEENRIAEILSGGVRWRTPASE